jgi:hypothetical protein
MGNNAHNNNLWKFDIVNRNDNAFVRKHSFVWSYILGIKTITSNGKTINSPVSFIGVGGTWQFQDAFTVGSTRGSGY